MVVDGSQGVEAQTLSTCYKAIDLGLEVIPVINKIDLPQAEPDRCKERNRRNNWVLMRLRHYLLVQKMEQT